MMTLFQKNLDEHADMIIKLIRPEKHVTHSQNILTESLSKEVKVTLCGNGGSVADAQYLAAECDLFIAAPNQVTPRTEKAHILIRHTICDALEQKLGLV